MDPIPIILRSGDAVVMAGPECRRAYHGNLILELPWTLGSSYEQLGIPRILEGTLPPHLHGSEDDGDEWPTYQCYLQRTRININVRQVFPKGFNPLNMEVMSSTP